MTHLYIYAFLAALVILFPKDALLLPAWVGAQVKLHYVNAKMFWFAWAAHRKLKKEFGALGWPVPPFRFIPIWNREELK